MTRISYAKVPKGMVADIIYIYIYIYIYIWACPFNYDFSALQPFARYEVRNKCGVASAIL